MRTKTKKNELEIPPPHQSIKLFPGLWINLSKKGGSLSVGGHGLTANISKKGVRETVGLPGTGISYQSKRVGMSQSHKPAKRHQSVTPARFLAFIAAAVVILWILAHLH